MARCKKCMVHNCICQYEAKVKEVLLAIAKELDKVAEVSQKLKDWKASDLNGDILTNYIDMRADVLDVTNNVENIMKSYRIVEVLNDFNNEYMESIIMGPLQPDGAESDESEEAEQGQLEDVAVVEVHPDVNYFALEDESYGLDLMQSFNESFIHQQKWPCECSKCMGEGDNEELLSGAIAGMTQAESIAIAEHTHEDETGEIEVKENLVEKEGEIVE